MTLARDISGPPGCSAGDGLHLLDVMPDAVVVLDGELATRHRNPAAEALFGPLADWLALWTQRVPPPSGSSWRTALTEVLETHTSARFERLRFAAPGGAPRVLDLTIEPTESAGARGLAVVLRDVTREADLAQRLAATENLAAVGRLAARVAHELNNPLDGTLRYVGLAGRVLEKTGAALEPEARGKLEDYLRHVREGLLRMTRIVADLLEFSRNAPVIRESGNINRVVEEALAGLAHLADRQHVTVLADFHDDPQMPVLEDTRLYQVCANLVRNAIDAMPAGGSLIVRTGIVERQVVIRIQDSGPGLPDTVERVFEPFYTTKPAGQGTGLGLAICREYLAQLGGKVAAENAPEGGAVFTVRIPVSACRTPDAVG